MGYTCMLLSNFLLIKWFYQRRCKKNLYCFVKTTLPSFFLIDGDTAVVSGIPQGMFNETNSKAQ